MYSTVVTISYSKAMRSGNALRLRKGAWGSDEDTLLRKCIEKYGEGKWHLVPQRAGLNRCRKSCRLRWLNYLRPSLNRGEFGADEVDLMIRLHRLLGNRWSLIGGRLPGRTANDVKNYWKTTIIKKFTTAKEVARREELIQEKQTSNIDTTSTGGTATVVIKPLPRTLSKGTRLPFFNIDPKNHMSFGSPEETLHRNNSNNYNKKKKKKLSPPTTLPPNDDGIEWWKNLFEEINVHGQQQDSLEESLEDLDSERGLIWKTDESTAPATEANDFPEDDWSDLWDFLNLSDDK